VRKIISILIVLGLVLAFSAVAVPAVGAACTATVVVAPTCAGSAATYTVNFTAPKTLQPGDLLSFEFGAGTTFGTFLDNDVTVNNNGGGAKGVLKSKVTPSGTTLNVEIPVACGTVYIGSMVQVVIPKVTNPGVGTYTLNLDYKESCCPAVVFGCATYTITPKTSTYDFFWDSSPTYPGLDDGFIPPFKACGQNASELIVGATAPIAVGAGWANAFNLTLKPTLVGCFGPCTLPVTVTLWLSGAPTGAKVSLALNSSAITHNLTLTSPVTEIFVGNYTLGNNDTITWPNFIHFDTVSAPGNYTICVKAFCPPGAESCQTGCNPQGSTVADECFNIKVYQWKEAFKIPLARKWNLISLPLVPLVSTTPAALLDAYAYDDQVVSIWYFDQNVDKWYVYPAGTVGGDLALTTIEDGKAYWMRIKYDTTHPAGDPLDGLWVWGTKKPVPPSAPSAYPVYLGWNMIGFTEVAPNSPMLPTGYLWNFSGSPTYGAVCGWNAGTQVWDPITAVSMAAGKGYWVPFSGAGTIYPP